MALIPKDESPQGFLGKYIPVPTVYATPQGRSATFATGQTNQTAPGVISFLVYRVSNYELVSITNELIEATAGNMGAFVDEVKLNIDTGFRNLGNDLAANLFTAGTGSRGSIGSITTSSSTAVTTIVLSNSAQVTQFEVNMVLVASATDGGAPSSDTVTITAVNRSTYTLTGNSSTTHSNSLSGNWAATGFLVQQGDIPSGGATGTGSYLKMSGLASWLPTTQPTTGDSFWNVDRSVDPTRLAGVNYNGSSQSIQEALIDASSFVAQEGGQPDFCFMNFKSYSALEKSMQGQCLYVDVKHEEADIAFSGLRVNAP